ncbi:glycosyltransferase family 9 protein [Ramlibacter sp.]|uniref:glycosyltransferase family 9 protein n=1 Tax=Ramlibacter sp. TaxID=1917967 RepID=UPI002FC668D2
MNSILVVATRQIGDVLLTTPLIRAARTRWPRACIDVIGFAGTLGMLRGNPDLNQLIETPARLGLAGFARLAGRLWRRYDLALVTQASDRAHLIACLAARERSGLLPPRHASNWWKRLLLGHAVVSQGDLASEHVVDEKLRLLAPWTASGSGPVKVIPPPATPLPDDIERLLRPDAVVIHAPSMWPYKQWAPEKFAELARALLARGHQVVLTGSGGARDQACIAPLRELAPPPHLLDVSGRLDFNQLAGLLARAALYIGPDTSVSHLAAATGVPTLAVFGPTNPQRWAPWPATASEAPVQFLRRAPVQSQGNVTLIQAELPCVPCGRAGCENHLQSRSDCLLAITSGQVLAQALRLLTGSRRSNG